MATYRADPDPDDPRVQEQIRDAVTRARGSALSSYMSQQDLFNAASANLSSTYGNGLDAGNFADAIHTELRRQAPSLDSAEGTSESVGARMSARANGDDHDATLVHGSPVTPVTGSRDPVMGLAIDHWFTDAEMSSLRHTAPYGRELMQRNYDATAPSEHYRGFAVGLVAVIGAVSPSDSIQRYQTVVEHVDDALLKWSMTPDLRSGLMFAMMNLWEVSKVGAPVSEIISFERGEIACVAECFYLACRSGL